MSVRTGKYLVLLLGGLAGAYIIVRAFGLSITCDEGWSANGFPQQSLFTFVTPEFIAGLNAHLLNSWLINLSVTLFGRHDWAARLPALCGGVMYIFFACRFALTTTSSWRTPALAALLLGNPYLLDFLSLARGYSLGLCFMMVGLTLILNKGIAKYIWAPVWLSVSALSNLSFIYPYLASLAVVWSLLLFGNKRVGVYDTAKRMLPSICSLAALTVVYMKAMRIAVLHNEHWWGSSAGFVDGTMQSLVRVSLYERSIPLWVYNSIAQVLIYGLVAVVLLVVVTRHRIKSDIAPLDNLKRMLLLFFIVWGGIVTEHTLFGTPYIIERGALFLYPVIVIIFSLFAEYCGQMPFISRMANAFVLLLTLLCMANTAYNVNFDHTATWSVDSCAREFTEAIMLENDMNNFTNEMVTLSTNVVNWHAIEYYLTYKMMMYVKAAIHTSGVADTDYMIIQGAEARKLTDQGVATIVTTCKHSDAVLVRRIR